MIHEASHDPVHRPPPAEGGGGTAVVVWAYPHTAGALRLETLLADGTLGDLSVTDGAVVTWIRGRASAQVRELRGVPRTGNLGTAFWGMLFGIVVSGPELSNRVESRQRALDESMEAVGVDRETLIELRRRLQPGGSAGPVICGEAVAPAIRAVGTGRSRDARSSPLGSAACTTRVLTADQERALHRAFAP